MANRFILDGRYDQLLAAHGIDVAEALRKAKLPEGVFCHRNPTMTAEGYYAFMEAVGRLCPDGATALALATGEGIEQFSPPIFAAFCSPDGRTCLERLTRYKKLVGPLIFTVSDDAKKLKVELADEHGLPIPQFLAECELAFLVNLVRRATKEDVAPLAVTLPQAPRDAIAAFLGCDVAQGPAASVAFSVDDMGLPFISHNDALWGYFEPELARRLSELDADGAFSARVRSALIEMLPAGASDADTCARKLGVSRRTLQRRLTEEATTFQAQLNHTRELLARHYLGNAEMRTDEIAYLLGYAELNSFLRAFSTWTGMSPSEYRNRMTSRV